MKNSELVVIVGPMYSGKTSELISYVEIYSLGRKKFKAFKPLIDDRYDKSFIVSHTNTKVEAVNIKSPEEITDYIDGDEKAVFIDEIQFFDESLKNIVNKLLKMDINVYCSGLDLSFKNNTFKTTTEIMGYADRVIKKKAVCHECGEYNATISYKKPDEENSEIDVGGFEKYIAVCRDCYEELKQKENMAKLFDWKYMF